MRWHSTLSLLRSFFHRRAALALATMAGLTAPVGAAERIVREPTSLVATPKDDAPADDLVGNDDGIGPDPGVDPLQPADDFASKTDFDPADDLVVPATGQDLWLTAANPWHPTASLSATRVFDWFPHPLEPYLEFKVDPSLPYDLNAELEVAVHTLPGFDYDLYFCVGWNTMGAADSLRIHHEDGLTHYFSPDSTFDYTPDSYCDAWTALHGPEVGAEPDWHYITLGMIDPPEDVVTWQVVAVRVVVTPRQ